MSLLLSLFLAAAQPQRHPALARAGDCGWVHGRFNFANGSSIQRIWVIGTNHMLALHDDDDYYPPSMQRLVKSGRFVPFEHYMYGDFLVCACEQRIEGHMQHVRFKAAKNLIVVSDH